MSDTDERVQYDANIFYTVLVEGSAESEDFVQAFFTWADNIGEAISKAMTVAIEEEHINNALPSEANTHVI